MEINPQIINWLLEGDVSIQYQVQRDLLDTQRPDLQERISREGWGARFLSQRKPDGHWGRGFYQPKWISTHYTLLDLKNLGTSPENQKIKETISLVLKNYKEKDGGINPAGTIKVSDVCINGMFLNYACYFTAPQKELESVIDYLIALQMPDGGFNCRVNRTGAVHSSLHTTLSVLEGILEYSLNGYTYRLDEMQRMAAESREFILLHKLFRSDHSGEIIQNRFLRLPYPTRWYYDILRALDYFQFAGIDYDERMQDALDVLFKKKRKDRTWPLQAAHPGQVHFEMEQTGKASRWNTLRALRVLNYFSETI